MWAPADLFGPGLGAFTLLLKRVTTYFYEHLVVLAAVVLLLAGAIAVLTMLTNRTDRRA